MKRFSGGSQLGRFAAVGLLTAAIYYGLAWLIFTYLGAAALLSSSVACVTALAFNYHAHYHWTFSAEAPHGAVLARYLAMVSIGTGLNGIIMYWGVDVLAGNFLLVQTIAAAVMVCWSLCLANYWVFKS